MKTQILNRNESTEQAILQAGEMLKSGKNVAIPTETVYGLGANALDEKAVAKIFEAKGRPQDNPLIVHIESTDKLELYCDDIPDKAYKLAVSFWPGPLTMVLKRKSVIPSSVSAGLDTVAIRLPSNEYARRIIAASGCPIAAPSANTSGSPSPTKAEHVLHDLDGRIDAVFDGGDSEVGLESTVISLVGDVPRLLRPGAVTPEMLKEVLGEIIIDKAVTQLISSQEKVSSPGMKYRHYAPRAKMTLIRGSIDATERYIKENLCEKMAVLCFDGDEKLFSEYAFTVTYGAENDSKAQASRLFDALRLLDRDDVERIYARCPKSDGIGLAVLNRISKAAAFDIVDV